MVSRKTCSEAFRRAVGGRLAAPVQARESEVEGLTWLMRQGSGLRTLVLSRNDRRPHQADVGGKVLQDWYRYYLLADKLGLGKTVEAGLIIRVRVTQVRAGLLGARMGSEFLAFGSPESARIQRAEQSGWRARPHGSGGRRKTGPRE